MPSLDRFARASLYALLVWAPLASGSDRGWPLAVAELLVLCGPRQVRKRRHEIVVGAHTWEVDEFLDHNAGLVLAEVELASPDEAFVEPAWLGDEVTSDGRYANVRLADRPWTRWGPGDGPAG